MSAQALSAYLKILRIIRDLQEELDILKGTKSYDNENRKSLPKNTKIPDIKHCVTISFTLLIFLNTVICK